MTSRPERGGAVFCLDAIALLRLHWAGPSSCRDVQIALRDAGYHFTEEQVRDGARRYAPPPENPLAQVGRIGFAPPPRPDAVRLVRPGTYPVSGFSMIGGRVV